MPEKPAILCKPGQNYPYKKDPQNHSKSWKTRFCRDFTILCDFDAILLGFCNGFGLMKVSKVAKSSILGSKLWFWQQCLGDRILVK